MFSYVPDPIRQPHQPLLPHYMRQAGQAAARPCQKGLRKSFRCETPSCAGSKHLYGKQTTFLLAASSSDTKFHGKETARRYDFSPSGHAATEHKRSSWQDCQRRQTKAQPASPKTWRTGQAQSRHDYAPRAWRHTGHYPPQPSAPSCWYTSGNAPRQH